MVFDQDVFNQKPIIKVIGVGGGGGNAINRMIQNDVKGVSFVAMNTDAQVLKFSTAQERLQLGKHLTKGLGAGAKSEVGAQAALESIEDIEEVLKGCDMVFITAGMGGGTGTGAAPIVAKKAKEMGILTIGIVTKPFSFEGMSRTRSAMEGISKLKEHVDTLIIIPNDRLLEVFDPDMLLLDAFRESDNVLRQGVQGIAELINFPGLINVDFADVRTVMENKGQALMGIGMAKGENRAVAAARAAIHSRLLEISIDGATDAIVNITSGNNLAISEVQQAINEIKSATDSDLNIIYGTVMNEEMLDEMIVTVIATGYELKSNSVYSNPFVRDIVNQDAVEEKPFYEASTQEKVETKSESKVNLPDWLKKKKSL